MAYINVILTDGTKVVVPEAETAEWVMEPKYTGADGGADTLRLVCKRGQRTLARFNGDGVVGYAWIDGTAPNA